jgi:hypothetical protein
VLAQVQPRCLAPASGRRTCWVRIRTFLTVRQPRLHGKPDHVARQRNGRNGRNPSPNDHSVARGACSVGDPPSLTHSLTHRSRGVAWVPRVAAGNPRVNPGARVRACGDERGASLPPPPRAAAAALSLLGLGIGDCPDATTVLAIRAINPARGARCGPQGLSDSGRSRVEAAYEAARASGALDAASYMMCNAEEFWAESTQAWFHASNRSDVRERERERERERAHDLTEIYLRDGCSGHEIMWVRERERERESTMHRAPGLTRL